MTKSRRIKILIIACLIAILTGITVSFAAWYDNNFSLQVTADSGDWNNSVSHVTFSEVIDGGVVVGYMLANFDSAVAELDIPAVYNDKPVMGVAASFRGYDNIMRLTLPDSITIIESNALSNMGNLTELNIGGGLTTLGDNAISYCNKLQALTLPKSLLSIGALAISYCDIMTNIRILAVKSNVNVAERAMTFKPGQTVKIEWAEVVL